jgi:hypothetical protein
VAGKCFLLLPSWPWGGVGWKRKTCFAAAHKFPGDLGPAVAHTWTWFPLFVWIIWVNQLASSINFPYPSLSFLLFAFAFSFKMTLSSPWWGRCGKTSLCSQQALGWGKYR